MMFNRAKNYTFPPELYFGDGSFLTVISEVKLLGVIISDDLKWAKNTQYIVKRAMKNIWTLRRLKKFNLDILFLRDIYIKRSQVHN
jgi:hypothetical protein